MVVVEAETAVGEAGVEGANETATTGVYVASNKGSRDELAGSSAPRPSPVVTLYDTWRCSEFAVLQGEMVSTRRS